MNTSTRVSFGLYAMEVKPDSIPSADDLQPFSKISDLMADFASSYPYASYEPDFWLLDGGYKFMPSNPASVHVGMMSLEMSDENGNFANPPVLTVDFTYPHTSDGLTMRFSQYSNDLPNWVTVAYYDAADALIRSDDYYPTTWEFITETPVEDFQKIVITFRGTNKPYRYLRLTGIDYGRLIYFTGSDVKAASVVEEIDPMSGEARFNTLNLRLYSADAQFSLINPSGYFQYLQERQPIVVSEQVGSQTAYIGQFYLDEWRNRSETEIEFECVDLLGVLDKITCLGGIWNDTPVETVLAALLEPIRAPYDLDASLYGSLIKGWIPICTYREALQHIALAIGAYLDCSRSSVLKIYAAPIAATATPSETITRSQKGQSQTLSLKPLVTGVEVTAHIYVTGGATETLFSGALPAGEHTITWDFPHYSLSIVGASYVTGGANYVTVSLAAPSNVSLNGARYIEVKRIYSQHTPDLPAGTKANVLKVADATLVGTGNGAAVCARIYAYHQQRLLQTMRMYAPMTLQVGDVVTVETLYNQTIKALVEKMSVNLSGGMVADMELVGVVNE